MRIWSLLVLIAIVFSIAAPVHFLNTCVSDTKKTVMLTLDVCDKAGQSLSSNFDVFTIHEGSYRFVPMAFSVFYKFSNPAFNSFFVISQKEQPPKV